MQIRKLFFLTFTLGAALVIAAFGTNGLKDLFATTLNPAEAAGGPPGPITRPSLVKVAGGPGMPISPTVTTIEFVPAPELPTRPPDAGGGVSNRDGNTLTLQSFFVYTGTQGMGAFGGGFATASSDLAPAGDAPHAGFVIMSGSTITGETWTEAQPALPSAGGEPAGFQNMIVIGQGEAVHTDAVPALPGEMSVTIAGGAGVPAQPASQKVVVTDATKIYHDVTPMIEGSAGGTHTVQQVVEPGSLDEMTEPAMVTVWGHLDGEQLVAEVILYQNPFPMVKP